MEPIKTVSRVKTLAIAATLTDILDRNDARIAVIFCAAITNDVVYGFNPATINDCGIFMPQEAGPFMVTEEQVGSLIHQAIRGYGPAPVNATITEILRV